MRKPVALVVALLLLSSCALQRDPKNELVHFMQQLNQNVDLADSKATLHYLHLSPQPGYPNVQQYTLPNGKVITKYVIYLEAQPLPKSPEIVIDRYVVAYPGGPANDSQMLSGNLMVKLSGQTSHALCVYEGLMTWTFGKPTKKSVAIDSFAPVYAWRLPGPNKLSVTAMFERDGCGDQISIGSDAASKRT